MKWVGLGSLGLGLLVGCAAQTGENVAPRLPEPAPAASSAPERERDGAEQWAERLSDPAQSELAIQRLSQLQADAAQNGTSAAFNSKVVATATRAYLQHDAKLNANTRVGIIRLLAHSGDAHAEPAFQLALVRFVDGKRNDRYDSDYVYAAHAVAEQKLSGSSNLLLRAFLALRASSPSGARTYLPMSEALLRWADSAWAPELAKALAVPMPPPTQASVDAFRDQQYWQVTAAQLLGVSGAPSGVEPLIQVMFDPQKADLHATALLALVKLEGSVARAARALEEPGHLTTAALVLGTTGRSDALPPLRKALTRVKDPVEKAELARALSLLPATAESIAAFKTSFATIPLVTELANGSPALATLAEASATFHDPALVSWLLDRVAKVAGKDDDANALRSALLLSALKLCAEADLPALEVATKRFGSDIEQKSFKQTADTLRQCHTDQDCLLKLLVQDSGDETRFKRVKAAYTIAMHPSAGTAAVLVAQLEKIQDPLGNFLLTRAIDHLLPNGSPELASALAAKIERPSPSASFEARALQAPQKQLLYRLRARQFAAPTPKP